MTHLKNPCTVTANSMVGLYEGGQSSLDSASHRDPDTQITSAWADQRILFREPGRTGFTTIARRITKIQRCMYSARGARVTLLDAWHAALSLAKTHRIAASTWCIQIRLPHWTELCMPAYRESRLSGAGTKFLPSRHAEDCL